MSGKRADGGAAKAKAQPNDDDEPAEQEPAPASPRPGVKPAAPLEGRQFSFRQRTEKDDPVVPFGFQGQQFHLHPNRINSLVAVDMTTISMDNGPMWEFFEGVLEKEFLRFRKLLRDPGIIVDIDELADLIKWMAEQTTNLPS